MSRRFSQLGAFLIAAAGAYASLADASAPAPTSRLTPARESRLEPPSVPAPVPVPVPAPMPPTADPAPDRAWGERIAARLDALSRRPPAVGGARDRDYERLAARLSAISRNAPRGTRVAMHVRDLESDQTVFDRGGGRLLNPASNQKLLTSIAAVELLGADYEFETRLARHGDALYLVGGGDPGLQMDHLYALAQHAAALGELQGVTSIVVDDSAFSPRHFGPGYDASGAGLAYMAPSGALSLAFNTVEVTVRPGGYGEPVEVQVLPPTPHVHVSSTAATGAGRVLSVDTRADGDRTLVRVDGTLAAGHAPVRLRRRIHDPGLFTAGAFAHVLAEINGAQLLPIRRGTVPESARTIATHVSLPLPDVLDSALKYSNNFCTEQVLRTLGWRATGEPGSWENGTEVVARFWEAVGEDAQRLRFVNGSGLSRTGRTTPRALVDLLARTQDDASPSAALLSTLAGAGGEGTLRLRLAHAQGRVRAKTGTLNGVSALSGVVISERGDRTLGFSILVNGGAAPRSRALQDRMVLAMLDDLEVAVSPE